MTNSKVVIDQQNLELHKEFNDLLINKRVKALYQPILSLKSGKVLGWEALIRGPSDSNFHKPQDIFDFAAKQGVLFAVERICREKSIATVGEFAPRQVLFLNIHPQTLCDPDFVEGVTLKLLREFGLIPQQIVFEITEKHNIKDFQACRDVVSHYRNQGYRIAIDDVGAGFSGLQAVAEMCPDFIKIDMSLVRNLDSDPIRRAVIDSLIYLAEKINCRVIAEGIETESEMNTLLMMGAHYGQGYYISRPTFPKPLQISALLADQIKRRTDSKKQSRGWGRGFIVGEIVMPATTVSKDTLVYEVKEKLDSCQQPICSLVVMNNSRPVGLVMRHHLYKLLSTQYGTSLYMQRSVDMVMNRSPLLLDVDMSIERSVEMVMGRSQESFFDTLIIVDGDGQMAGVVGVKQLLDALGTRQVELARGANPLTGLPGNVAIEEELAQRLNDARECTIIYADLDRFKAYNDTYGFKNGDQMLVLLAKIITYAANRYGDAGFVGHIGGDDMIVIMQSRPKCVEKVCQSIVRLFDRLVKKYFSSDERTNGKFSDRNREGEQVEVPLVSVSLAIVDCWDEKSYRTLGERAAQVKKYAKAQLGSVYVRDRRD